LDKYELHGYKVLRLFPRVRLKPDELEKNATLYGSLKQICPKGAAKALIWKYKQKRDGMRTWLDLLTSECPHIQNVENKCDFLDIILV
jgi:N6-adenosine-specific RNA methylase IME4